MSKKLHQVNNNEKKIILNQLSQLIQILSKNVNFDSAILFGSFLKSNEFNDIDILLIKNTDLGVIDFINLYYQIQKINQESDFSNFYLTYYDSSNKPKEKIKISLELDCPIMKELFPDFYDTVFFKDKSFKVISGIFNPEIYLNKNIQFNSSKNNQLRKIIEYLHTTPTYFEFVTFCKTNYFLD